MLKKGKITYGLLAAFGFLILGTVGYALIEHYTMLDAFYMTVITLSTVGFGEIEALSPEGKIFTIFLILFGFGSLAYLAHAFSELVIERATSRQYGRKMMDRKIQQLRKHYIICGYGRVGEAAAEHFHNVGAGFVVIESDESQIRLLDECGYLYVHGDATREETLFEAGIKKAAALLALLNADPDNLFTVLTARELNPTLHIIARTEMTTSESRILRAGADSIISPYASAGRRVADKILQFAAEGEPTSTGGYAKDGPHWVTVTTESGLEDHVVETAGTFLDGAVVGIRRKERDILVPEPDEKILIGDKLLVTSRPLEKSGEEPKQAVNRKIVLIDDNPVIIRLYTRLFQKQGYTIIPAATGKEGMTSILQEKPVAAIVDFHLPDMTGLDICRKISGMEAAADIKLFLFTGDEEQKSNVDKKKSGIDSVIVKGPDAEELVETVKNRLNRKGH